jgi:5-methylcytosine-specific restriction endonuclease McrA
MPREYDSAEYRKNRKIILEGSPYCYYCRRRKADTVDHVVEVDRGGTSELENMVPCCRTCNSRKGQDYLTRKNASRLAGRDEAVEAAE